MNPNPSNEYSTGNDPVEEAHRRRWWQKILAAMLPLLIIGVGIAGASYFLKTGPKAAKQPPKKVTPLVGVEPVQFKAEQIVVSAMGTVVPSRKIDLKTSVAGEVIWTNPSFTEGGLLKKGDIVLKIDPVDYRLRIIEREAQVAQAQYALELELGHQDVARREWDILGKGKSVSRADHDLALRKPHLQKVRAELKAAQAMLDQEKKNLERTIVKTPFNAMVGDRKVDVGSHVTAQSTLATLTGTDRYWVQTSIPMDRLDWIDVPRQNDRTGSKVTVYQGGTPSRNDSWEGSVVRLMGDLDPKGRMARILVAIDDPLKLSSDSTRSRPLIMGAYVHAEITGRKVDRVARLIRPTVHENNTVWIMQDDGTLSVRTVSILWRDNDAVLVDQGILPGEKLIVTDLAAPVDGMQIRVADEIPAAEEPQKEKKTP